MREIDPIDLLDRIMRVLIAGDRNWQDRPTIAKFVARLPQGTTIIEGEARGADSIARDCALDVGLSVERYPANWNKYGRAAGYIRNQQMLDEGRPDLVAFFHQNLSESRGTKNMVRIAIKANIPVMNGSTYAIIKAV
mgnify:FL=1